MRYIPQKRYLIIIALALCFISWKHFITGQVDVPSEMQEEPIINVPQNEFVSKDEEKFKQRRIIVHAKKMNYPELIDVLQKIKDSRMQEQVYGIVRGYYPDYITRVGWKDGDVVFMMNGVEIWYAGGRLISSESLSVKDTLRPIMYTYSTDSIYDIFDDIPKLKGDFHPTYTRSSDFQRTLTGGMPQDIESLITTVRILEIPVRLHPITAKYALRASHEVLALAETDAEVRKFIDDLKTISGYVNRKVRKSTNISMHSFGLAMDLIPYDYKYKVTYWQWAKVLYPETWSYIPLEKRWLIPEKVVKIFERHGFIWGGKWATYDTMHLEFRPELIYYAEARKETGSPTDFSGFKGLMNNNQNTDTELR